MLKKLDKNEDRVIRHARVRKNLSGTSTKPRLNVYRSLNNIYAQLIDDTTATTICSASTLDKEVAEQIAGLNKVQKAEIVGKVIAERAKAKGISTVVFDRSGYIYIGRVKAVAEGARANGLVF